MHTAITKAFKAYHVFGFTGTPIFAENTASGGKNHLKTTEQAFGEELHAYTIVDAIRDDNVLPFRIDYINTMKMKDQVTDKKIRAIDSEAAAGAPERIRQVTRYILEHFEQKTKRNDATYSFKKVTNIAEIASDKEKDPIKRVKDVKQQITLNGFNSIFATSSIGMAKKYYNEFKAQNSELRIATIFSFSANEAESEDGILPDEEVNIAELDQPSREFLDKAIGDYNQYFKTNYSTDADKFESYYKDISQRMKKP